MQLQLSFVPSLRPKNDRQYKVHPPLMRTGPWLTLRRIPRGRRQWLCQSCRNYTVVDLCLLGGIRRLVAGGVVSSEVGLGVMCLTVTNMNLTLLAAVSSYDGRGVMDSGGVAYAPSSFVLLPSDDGRTTLGLRIRVPGRCFSGEDHLFMVPMLASDSDVITGCGPVILSTPVCEGGVRHG